MSIIKPYLKLIRPKQWVKNLFLFIPLVFDGQLSNIAAFIRTFIGFLILCALYSGVYVINDIIDRESDRAHPKKRHRPVAAGTIPVRNAALLAVLLLTVAFLTGRQLSRDFFIVEVIIVSINLIYSKFLKKEPLLDVILIGCLFILRVIAGLSLITVKVFSPWLFLMTFMLALFLGFGKRRAEIVHPDVNPDLVRPTLNLYSVELLDQLITIVSSVTIIAYSLYTFSGPTLPDHNIMMFTIPVVTYGIFRYQYLIYTCHEGEAPEDVIMTDRPFQITLLIYIAIVLYALYFHS